MKSVIRRYLGMRKAINTSRGLGEDPASLLQWGNYLAACGATGRDIEVFAKIVATKRITKEDLVRLHGSDIDVSAVWEE